MRQLFDLFVKHFATWKRLLWKGVDFAVLPPSAHPKNKYVSHGTFLGINIALLGLPTFITEGRLPGSFRVLVVVGIVAFIPSSFFWIYGKPTRSLIASDERFWHAFVYVYAGPVWFFQLLALLLLAVL